MDLVDEAAITVMSPLVAVKSCPPKPIVAVHRRHFDVVSLPGCVADIMVISQQSSGCLYVVSN
jgi:hypothetical protein